MALYSIDSEEYVDYIPHREDFERWRSRLSDGQFEAICNELRRMIDGAEIHTAGRRGSRSTPMHATMTKWRPAIASACSSG